MRWPFPVPAALMHSHFAVAQRAKIVAAAAASEAAVGGCEMPKSYRAGAAAAAGATGAAPAALPAMKARRSALMVSA